MNILIVGSGAMGSLFAGRLKQNGVDVTLFNRFNDHIKSIQENGLTIVDHKKESTHVVPPIITAPEKLTDHFDLVIVLVKTFATEIVLEKVLTRLSNHPPILTLQNGIGNLETIQEIAPNNDVFVGVTYAGASIDKPGVLLHRAWGNTIIGSSDQARHGKLLSEIASIFSKCGLHTEVSDNVQSIIWEKLFTNLAYNGLTAITRLKNGDTLCCNEGRDIIEKVVREAEQVALAKGIRITNSDPVKECIRLGEEEIGMNTSSMLSDILHQRKTEIEAINGKIVEEGKKYGIPTPYNEMIYNLIKLIENSYSRIVS